VDEQQKVRTITALALAALAEAATPYGIESFDSVLKPLWKGIRQHRGKVNMSIAQTMWVFVWMGFAPRTQALKDDARNKHDARKAYWEGGTLSPISCGLFP
jgi:Na+/proline symporter